MIENKKHCYSCAYRKAVPGNAHIECTRDFSDTEKPKLDAYGIKMGWCFFPILFDPVWVGKCKGFSKVAKKQRKEGDTDPLISLFAILGGVGR